MIYDPTPKQEQAIREWIQEAIIPLIEQVLVKKLGQAMSFAEQEVIASPRKPLTDEEIYKIANDLFYGNGPCDTLAMCRAIEAAHGIKE